MTAPHERTQFEFAAKIVNDALRKAFPDEKLHFMSFVMDEGKEGHIGFLASNRRIDSVRLIMEWLAHAIEGFDRRDLLELIKELEKELPDV